MSENSGKRKADAAGLGAISQNSLAARLTKMIRSGVPDLPGAEASPTKTTWQRFGENAQYMPLSQVAGADEDDAQAEVLVQGSQGADESSVSSAILYGMPPNLPCKLPILDESP